MKNRTRITSVKKFYTKIPNDLYNLGLDAAIVGLVCFLLSCPEDFNPSTRYLSRKFDKDRKTVKKWLDVVEKHGIIRKYRSGSFRKRTPDMYEFLPRTSWKKYAK